MGEDGRGSQSFSQLGQQQPSAQSLSIVSACYKSQPHLLINSNLMMDSGKFNFFIPNDKQQHDGNSHPISSASSGIMPQSTFSFGSLDFSFDSFGSKSSQSTEAPKQQPFSFGNESATAAEAELSAFQFSFSSTEQPSFSFGSSENQKSEFQNDRSAKQRKTGATRRPQARRGAGNGQFQFSRKSLQTDSSEAAASFDMLPLDTVFLTCSWLEFDFSKNMTGLVLQGTRFSSAAASLLFCRDADGHHRLLYPNLLVTDDVLGMNRFRQMLHCLPFRAVRRLVFRVSAKSINALDNMVPISKVNIWNQLCLAENQCLEVLSFVNSDSEKSGDSSLLPRKNYAFSLPLSIDKLPPFAHSLKYLSYFETGSVSLKHFVPALLPNLEHLTVYFAFAVTTVQDNEDEVLTTQTLTVAHQLHGEDYKPFVNLREFVISGRFIPGLYQWMSLYSRGLKHFALSDRSCPGTTRAGSSLLSAISNFPGCFDSSLGSLSIQCGMGDVKLQLQRFNSLRKLTLNLSYKSYIFKTISHLTQLRELTLIEFSDRQIDNKKVLYANMAAALAGSLRSLALVNCTVDQDFLAGSVPPIIEHYTVVTPFATSSLCPRIAFGAKRLTIKNCQDRVGGLVGLFIGDFEDSDLEAYERITTRSLFRKFVLPRSKHIEIIDSTILVETLKKILAQREVEVASLSIRNCSIKRSSKSGDALVESLSIDSIEDLFSYVVNNIQ